MERNNDEAGNQNKRGRDGSEPPEGDENKRRKTDDVPTPPPVNNLDLWGQWIPTLALNKIFQNLVDAEGPLPALCRMGAVSRYWRQVSKQSSLWHKLDLSMDSIIKQDDVLQQIFNTNNLSQVKDINLSKWTNLTDSSIQMIADSCPKLNSVTLSETAVSDSALAYLVSKCLLLTKIDLSAMTTDVQCGKALHHLLEMRGSQLQSLRLSSNCLKGFNNTLALLVCMCCELRELDLSGIQFTSEPVIFDVEQMQSVCKRLQILRLSNTPFLFNLSSSSEQVESLGFRNLQELDLSVTDQNLECEVSNNLLIKLLKGSVQLKSLNVSGCVDLTWEFMQKLPATNLRRLLVSNSPLVTFEGVESILSKWCHSLVQLDVSYNMYPGMLLEMVTKQLRIDPVNTALQVLDLKGTDISTSRIKAILEIFPRLDCLNLVSCRGLKRGQKKEYAGTHLDELRRAISNIIAQEDVITSGGFCF